MTRSEPGTRLSGSAKKSIIRRGPIGGECFDGMGRHWYVEPSGGTRVAGGMQEHGWPGMQISGWQRMSM